MSIFEKIIAYKLNHDKKFQQEFPVFTISVGNITMGGAGKTPFTIELCNLLLPKHKCGIITRGYRGKYKEDATVVSQNGTLINDDPSIVGDEAVLMAMKTPMSSVVVARDRNIGIKTLLKFSPDIEIVILDDAFSHLKVRRDLDILIIDTWRNLQKAQPLPFGSLREPIRNISRTDLIFLNLKGPYYHSNKLFLEEHFNIPIYDFTYRYKVYKNGVLKNININMIQKVIAFTGIAHPDSFFHAIQEININPIFKIPLPDHFRYGKLSLRIIEQLLRLFPEYYFVTTEKDFVKLRKLPEKILSKIIFPEMEVEISQNGVNEIVKKVAEWKK